MQHGLGTKARARLAEIGIEVDAGWRVLQDQPRRGLVVAVPVDADHAAVLEWLLRAGTAVCRTDFRDRWVAIVHRP